MIWSLVLLIAGTSGAPAQQPAGGTSDSVFLVQLIVLMLAGRLLGEAMRRIGQPSVMGQLLAGILLGPAVFGSIWPQAQQWVFPAAEGQRAMLDAISQLGILLLLLLTGMEVDLNLARKVGRSAVSVSVAGVAVPFACGVALGWHLPSSLLPDEGKRLVTALFLGTALSISSIKIVGTIVREMNFTRRELGQLIVSSAIIEDTIGWIIIAITLSLAQAGNVDVQSIARSLIGTAIFLIASLTVGRRIVFHLIRWANDSFESEYAVVTLILVIMGAMAVTTQAIGVHTVLGAFVAGVLIGDSPILTRHIDEQLRGLIMAFFMPVFFATAGLSTDVRVLGNPTLGLLALGLIAAASIGKFAGAFVGSAIGGLSTRAALALACAMNARGSTEIIVASIGLSMGALNEDLFTIVVTMAVVTTMAMPPMLRWSLSRVPISKAEQERLEREDIEAKGFVANLERLLLAVDHSANGRFASRLAGLLAGPRGLPVTILRQAEGKGVARKPNRASASTEAERGRKDANEKAEQSVKSAAERSKAQTARDDAAPPVTVTVSELGAPAEEAIAKEAAKGYDLLFVGLESVRSSSRGFDPEVVRITSAFDGPLAIIAAHGIHLQRPDRGPLHILVPDNGTESSRHALELAINIARVSDATIAVLYVSNPRTNWRRSQPSGDRARQRMILDEAVELADKYDRKIKVTARSGTASEAILSEVKRSGCNLILMGVSRRPGQKLLLGNTAAAIFESAPTSVVILAV
jgi:Kef-type K+ transport system membrane component KefB/nucleotide-binding universal stress UspA family protein